MTCYAYLAVSLDGCIAGPDDDLDWLDHLPNPEKSDFGYGEFEGKMDAIVMGRRTFDVVSAFDRWPYHRPVFVLSSTLKQLTGKFADRAELMNAAPRQVVGDLAARGYNKLYVDGGKTIQRFLWEDLIDEMTITHVATVLGGGIHLFGPLEHSLAFTCRKTEALNEYLVKCYYIRAR